MTEELKKAIELLKDKANIYDNSPRDDKVVTKNVEETANAFAIIISALSTDKTREVVKRHRLELEEHRYEVGANYAIHELDDIIAEIEGDK